MPIRWARTVTRWLSQNYAWLLMLSCLLLFTTQTLFNFPIAVMAVIGLYRLWRAPTKYWQDRGVRVLLGLFLCLWLPMLFSLVDAVEAGRATSQSLTYLRFFFAGVFALDTLRDHTARRRLFMGTSIFVAFWCVDAMIQLAFGRDLFGYPYNGSQLNGLFHPKLRLGLLTATFFPILLEVARQSVYRWWWVGAAVIPALAAILLSGNRNAWFMLAVAAAGYLLFLRTIQRGLSWIRITSFAAVILGLVLVAALQYPPFQSRVQTILMLLSGEREAVAFATSYRLSLWRTAANIATAHWLNGVGPRGFRYVYKQYAGPDDYFLSHGYQGQTHPHQVFLEVFAETGIIGVTGYLAFWWLLWKRWRQLETPGAVQSGQWLLCTVVTILPTGSHLAFYGSYWSSIVWWLLAIALATGAAPSPPRVAQ